jgi:polyprenyl-phospho-N-acetylgalactosaminyl synthase
MRFEEGGTRSVWVVIPIFNESDRIGGVLDGLLELSVTIVAVDDCSTDDSPRIAAEKATWFLRHVVNLGQGAALQTGMRFALSRGADVIVTFDADGQHEPPDVVNLVDALFAKRVDFALGSRFLGEAPGIPWTRRAVLRLGIVFTRIFSRLSVTDTHNGLRAMTRRGAQVIHITLNRMEHASEILDLIADSRFPYVEVPVRIRYSQQTLAKGQASSGAFRMAAKLLAERLR